MRGFIIILVSLFLVINVSPVLSLDTYYQSVKTLTHGTACSDRGVTKDQVEWEALLNAMNMAKEIAQTYIQKTKAFDVSEQRALKKNYDLATVDIMGQKSQLWYTDARGRQCYTVKFEAEVKPKEPPMRSYGSQSLPINMEAKSDINPNRDGKSLPVFVHVYQLSGKNAFNKADLRQLLETPEQALGSTFLTKNELTIRPSTEEDINLNKKSNARYLGVAAFYRKPQGNDWKKFVTIKVPENTVINRVDVKLSKTQVQTDVKKTVKEPEPPGVPSQTSSVEPPVIPPSPAPSVNVVSGGGSLGTPPPSYQRLEIWTDKKEYVEGEFVKIYVRPRKDCYAYVVYEDVEGNFILLFPNQYRTKNFLKGGTKYEIPTSKDRFNLQIKGPFGYETIHFYGSTSPIGGNIDTEPSEAGYSLIKTNLSRNDNSTMIRSIDIVLKNSSGCEKLRSIQIVPKTVNMSSQDYVECNAVAEYFKAETHIKTQPRVGTTFY
jgi:type VI secretion system VasD/TssJ family lipoprotein